MEHWQCTVVFYYCLFLFILILATAFLTAGERALIGDMQFRRGPRKVGFFGSLQPIVDAAKLVEKETIHVRYVDIDIFRLSAYMSFSVSALMWSAVPFGFDVYVINMSFSVFVLFNLSILHLFTIVFAGWSSKSKYSALGSLRTTAQLVSYDICIIMNYLYIFKMVRTLNIMEIYADNAKNGSFIYFLAVPAVFFFVASLAELSRHPFDLPEAESELVAGYNTEYSSIKFALFFLGEYLSVFSYAVLFSDLFLGPVSLFMFFLNIAFIVYLIIKLRALLPRYRYDQLMTLCWKYFLPVLSASLFFLFFLEYISH